MYLLSSDSDSTRVWIFFLRTWHLYSARHLYSAFQLCILSEVRLLNFLRLYDTVPILYTIIYYTVLYYTIPYLYDTVPILYTYTISLLYTIYYGKVNHGNNKTKNSLYDLRVRVGGWELVIFISDFLISWYFQAHSASQTCGSEPTCCGPWHNQRNKNALQVGRGKLVVWVPVL